MGVRCTLYATTAPDIESIIAFYRENDSLFPNHIPDLATDSAFLDKDYILMNAVVTNNGRISEPLKWMVFGREFDAETEIRFLAPGDVKQVDGELRRNGLEHMFRRATIVAGDPSWSDGRDIDAMLLPELDRREARGQQLIQRRIADLAAFYRAAAATGRSVLVWII